MQVACIIPARGGSKGIPKKNLRPLLGKSLLEYAVSAGRASEQVQDVFVSTDDAEIAACARIAGSSVIERPASISGDDASSESALLHGLQQLADGGIKPELTVFLQCTTPLTTGDDIDGAINALLSSAADCCLTVSPSHRFLWRSTESGGWEGINHSAGIRQRRQEQAPQFVETGGVYVMRTAGFLRAKHRFFGKTVGYVVPSWKAWEIDEVSDLAVCEALLRVYRAKAPSHRRLGSVRAVVFDFDGVFTNNKVHLNERGEESVVCDRSDGLGLARLKAMGILAAVLSTETNAVVARRCEKLTLEYRQGLHDKLAAFKEWLQSNSVAPSEAVFVGNDANDLACIEYAGIGVAVADAYECAKETADIVLSRKGGRGAVREMCDLVIAAMKEKDRCIVL